MDGDTVVGTVRINQKVTRDFIDDTLCTALDAGYGWSHYWIMNMVGSNGPDGEDISYPYESISRGGLMHIRDVDGELHQLTLDKFMFGLSLFAGLPDGRTPAQIADDPADGPEADAILQLALLGEIVYG
jgi:hypothetical protein